jgi:hypothetical protein
MYKPQSFRSTNSVLCSQMYLMVPIFLLITNDYFVIVGIVDYFVSRSEGTKRFENWICVSSQRRIDGIGGHRPGCLT